MHSGSEDFKAKVGPWQAKQGGFSDCRLSIPVGCGKVDEGVPGLEMTATSFSEVRDEGIDWTFRLPVPSMRTSATEAEANKDRYKNLPRSIFII